MRVGLIAVTAAWVFGAASALWAAGPAAYRTDGGDEKLSWYRLKAGEFPPEGSAHHIGGELFEFDWINRTGSIRVDRDDTQRRGEWDRPMWFAMLPYGAIRYHGPRRRCATCRSARTCTGSIT